jgi:ribosomal protein S27E
MTNTATLTNKRRGVGYVAGPGRFIATLTCGCGHVMTVGFAGWSALVCEGCGEVIERPKAGRPPRAKKAASARFELRLTDAEAARWSARAKRRGVSLSEMVRECVDGLDARTSELTATERDAVGRLVNALASNDGAVRARMLRGVLTVASRT